MSLPTLLKKGSILEQEWMNVYERRRIQSERSIDWIMHYLTQRTWPDDVTAPEIQAKGPGWRVGIFRAGTGTGKSTTIPPALFNTFYEGMNIRRNIICTQPTVATATSIPQQICMYNPNLIMGQTIGYQTGSLIRKPNKGVLFATIGILLQQLKILTDEEFMRKYSFIILDEIHNRSIDTDLTLYYLKNLLKRNYALPHCPYVILTSGTFEPEVFMNYFECPPSSFLDIVGSSFPIQDNFAPYSVNDYIEYSTQLVHKIHIENMADITNNELFRDILIFVQGGAQITKISDKLHWLNRYVFSDDAKIKSEVPNLDKLYMSSSPAVGGDAKPSRNAIDRDDNRPYLCPIAITSDNIKKGEDDYQNIYSDISNVIVPIYEFDGEDRTDKVLRYVRASRRVMIGTNAIETGLTIDTLRYCIDTGFVNESQFNPNYGCNTLLNKNVTQASSTQRRGRVGRKFPGVFYTCYTKETFNEMPALPFSEITKADLSPFILDLVISETESKIIDAVDPKDIERAASQYKLFQNSAHDQRKYILTHAKPFIARNLNFIQYPAADSMSYSLEKLCILGFIDNEYNPTMFGMLGSKFRKLSLENVRMILAGFHHGASVLHLITMMCFMTNGHQLGIKKNKYVPMNPLGVSAEEAEYFFTNIIADECIEYLFIWEAYLNIVGKYASNGKVHPSDWCKEVGISYDAMNRIVDMRDEVLGDIMNIGINPYYNSLGLERGKYNLTAIIKRNLYEGLEEVRKFKKCIYEGYRMNLFVLDGRSYVSNYAHYPLTLPRSKLMKPLQLTEDIRQVRPKYIVVSSVLLQPSQTTKGAYEFNGGDISIMDGFVDVDLTMLSK